MEHLLRLSRERTQGNPKCAETDARYVGDSHPSCYKSESLKVTVTRRMAIAGASVSAHFGRTWVRPWENRGKF